MRNQINSLCPSWLLEHPSRAQPCCSPASLPSPWPVPWLFSTFLLHALPLPSQPSLLLGWLTGASCTGSLTNPLLPSSSSFPLVPSYPFLAAWTSFPPLLTSVLAISRSAPPQGLQAAPGWSTRAQALLIFGALTTLLDQWPGARGSSRLGASAASQKPPGMPWRGL